MRTPTLPAVELVDEVVLPTTETETWLSRWREAYLPGARQRGMALVSVARGFAGADATSVRITWRLSDPYAFYLMRGTAAADPEVGRFWAETDAVAVSRRRQALQQEVAA